MGKNYIDRDKLIEEVKSGRAPVCGYLVIDWIMDAPVVEFYETPQEKWIKSYDRIQCPCCNVVYEIDMYSPICAETAKHCPSCGARLYGGEYEHE